MDNPSKDARIMILDDEPLIAMTTEHMILDFGYTHVDVFCRLAEAEQAILTQTYDVAILDVNVDGKQTSHDLAHSLRSAGTRVVFATGNSVDDETLQNLSDLVIGKPFGEADIEKALS